MKRDRTKEAFDLLTHGDPDDPGFGPKLREIMRGWTPKRKAFTLLFGAMFRREAGRQAGADGKSVNPSAAG